MAGAAVEEEAGAAEAGAAVEEEAVAAVEDDDGSTTEVEDDDGSTTEVEEGEAFDPLAPEPLGGRRRVVRRRVPNGPGPRRAVRVTRGSGPRRPPGSGRRVLRVPHDPRARPQAPAARPQAPAARPQAPPATAARPQAPPATAARPQAPPVPQFAVGDNVLVTMGRHTFLAQVFKVVGNNYHVYFVGNGEKAVVNPGALRPEVKPSRTRQDYLNSEFYFDGADDLQKGRFKVRRIDGDKNEYVCVRLSGGTSNSINVDNFDIAYVMSEVRAEEEYVRERGPGWGGRR